MVYNILVQKQTLSKEQIHELVSSNRYPVNPHTKFFSRCIDGRYLNTPNLQPLAIPGADAGELAIILATANAYGFTVYEDKVVEALLATVGGVKNFCFHTDQHADQSLPAGGCGHLKQMKLDPPAYQMEPKQFDFIISKLSALKQKGAQEDILEGEHMEGAVIIVSGDYSLYPRFELQTTNGGAPLVEVFVFHQSLVNDRHRILAQNLIDKDAVKLFPGCDAEYLYEVLSDTTDNHLFETAKRLAKDLPLFGVNFQNDGAFKVVEMEKI